MEDVARKYTGIKGKGMVIEMAEITCEREGTLLILDVVRATSTLADYPNTSRLRARS